jgi:glucosamine-6-phosphate deaminase
MSDLLAQEGSAYDLNINMFNVLQRHNGMAGRKNTDDTYRPEERVQHKKSPF